jgi:hypothetical protein
MVQNRSLVNSSSPVAVRSAARESTHSSTSFEGELIKYLHSGVLPCDLLSRPFRNFDNKSILSFILPTPAPLLSSVVQRLHSTIPKPSLFSNPSSRTTQLSLSLSPTRRRPAILSESESLAATLQYATRMLAHRTT